MKTEIINKWWDNLSHETKEYLIKNTTGLAFNWGYLKNVT